MAPPPIVFILGPPGSGKGTVSTKLISHFPKLIHINVGDLLRTHGDEHIQECLREGLIVKSEITMGLVSKVIDEAGGEGVIVDGFPRKMDQAIMFEESISMPKFVLSFEVPPDELERRLLERGKTSGRSDDNIDSIRKRFKTFKDISQPCLTRYKDLKLLHEVDGARPPEVVWQEVLKIFMDHGFKQ